MVLTGTQTCNLWHHRRDPFKPHCQLQSIQGLSHLHSKTHSGLDLLKDFDFGAQLGQVLNTFGLNYVSMTI